MKRTGSIMRRIVLALCMVLLLAWFGGINVDKVQAASNDKGMKDFVTRLYSVCLGRNPDTAGLNDWVKQLKNGMSGADVAAGFIFSNEFMSKNLCDSCYVTSLYQCFLGRQPDSVGKADWMKRLQEGRTRGWVFNGFVGSQEFSKICESYGIVRGNGDWSGRTVIVTGDCALCGSHNKSASDFVTRLYNVCLDRNPDEAGLSSWINALKTGSTGAEVASGFVFSKEFQNKNLCNDHFVEYMYKAFFNRGADWAF